MKSKPIPQKLLSQILSPKFQKRFWSKVEQRGPTECWPWKASLSVGYGQFGFWDRTKRNIKKAHKIAWISHHKKDVPDGFYVLHSCIGNKRCCNPDHLKLGTHQDNMDDMVEQGRCALIGKFGKDHPAWKPHLHS